MDVKQIFELGKQYWPFAVWIILTIGNVISWYVSLQRSRADKDKSRADIEKSRADIEKSRAEAEKTLVETEKLRIEVRKLQAEEQLQLELRKGETGYQPSEATSKPSEATSKPSEATSKRESPELVKANWTIYANIGFGLLGVILFFVDLYSVPLTAYVLANMMYLLFTALLNVWFVGFQILQLQEQNNFRIQYWLAIEGLHINLELAKIQHEANVGLTKTHFAADAELTMHQHTANAELIARARDEIIDHIKKLGESPGNHPSQTTNPVKPE